MRGQLSAVGKTKIQTKVPNPTAFFKQHRKQQVILHCYILTTVIQWVNFYSGNSSSDKESHLTLIILCFFISCSYNDLLPCFDLAVSKDPVKRESLRHNSSSQAQLWWQLIYFYLNVTPSCKGVTHQVYQAPCTLMLNNFQYHGWLRENDSENMC